VLPVPLLLLSRIALLPVLVLVLVPLLLWT